MTESLKPKAVETASDETGGYSFRGTYIPALMVPTSLSEGGIAHLAGIEGCSEDGFRSSYCLNLQYLNQSTTGKLFPTTSFEGQSTNNSAWALLFGLGRLNRGLPITDKNLNIFATSFSRSDIYLGRGEARMDHDDVVIDGETYSFEGESDGVWRIGNRTQFLGFDITPWGSSGPALSLGAAFGIDVRLGNAGSLHNGLGLSVMFPVSFGYSNLEPWQSDSEKTSPSGMLFAFAQLAHSFAQRLAMNSILADNQASLGGLTGSSSTQGDRGSMEDVPIIQGAAAILGAYSNPYLEALGSEPGWFWAYFAAKLIGGAAFLAAESEAGKSAGLSDVLSLSRPLWLAIAGAEAPDKRANISDDDLRATMAYANLGAYILGSALTLIGGAADSQMASAAGGTANTQIAMSPDLINSGLVENRSIGYAPVTSDNRGALIFQNSCRGLSMGDFSLFLSAAFVSPALTPGNIGNRLSPDEPYGNAKSTTDINSNLGIEWSMWKWFSIMAGAGTKAVFGGGDAVTGGLGVSAALNLSLFADRESSVGFAVGLVASHYWLFPRGEQNEIMPWVGVVSR